MNEEIVGKLGRHKNRPERLAIISNDGAALVWFAQDQTRDELVTLLAADGYVIRDDDVVVKRD